MRALAPSTEAQYQRILERARRLGGLEYAQDWKPSQRELLRAAALREAIAAGEEVTAAAKRIDRILPRIWSPKRRPIIPGEEDALRYDHEASLLDPRRRALAFLPIALGLRASEVCGLTRDAVKAAVATGELVVLGKGGKERILPAQALRPLLEEVLTVPAASRPFRLAEKAEPPKAWQRVGEILSRGRANDRAKLRALVKEVGRRAGLNIHTHSLRHAFATRMNRDGAPLATIQAALGHASIATTSWYVHPTTADIARFVRTPKAKEG